MFRPVLFGTALELGGRYDAPMAIDRNNDEERVTRMEAMLAEFRTAQQRRLVKQGVALWTGTERALHHAAVVAVIPPTKLN